MKTPRLNGFFDWLKRGAVPIDGIVRRVDNAHVPTGGAELEQERDVVAPRVEPLPQECVRWGNFR